MHVSHHAVAFPTSTCYRTSTVTGAHVNQKQGLEKPLVRAGTALADCSPRSWLLFIALTRYIFCGGTVPVKRCRARALATPASVPMH